MIRKTLRRPDALRARRTLILAAALVALAQTGTGLFLDYVQPYIRFPQAGIMMRKARSLPRSPDILFLGSSRSGNGLQLDVLRASMRQPEEQDKPLFFNSAVEDSDAIAICLGCSTALTAGIWMHGPGWPTSTSWTCPMSITTAE